MISSWTFVIFTCFSPFPHNIWKNCANFVPQGAKSSAFCINFWCFQFIRLWNITNFSTLYSVQNRFFSTLLRQYGLLSRHLLELQWLQNLHLYRQLLHLMLLLNSVLFQQDIFQYNHLESEIFLINQINLLRNNVHCCHLVVLAQQSRNGQPNITSSSDRNFIVLQNECLHSTNSQQKSYFKPALPQRAARLLWNSFFFDYFSKTCKIVRFGSYLFHTCPHFAYPLSFLF